jgi:hypothetical protein
LTAQDVEKLLTAHIASDPFRTSEHYWPAEKALDAQVPGVSSALITQYYEKVQSVWPEVGPNLDNRDDSTLRAWTKAAAARPELHWNSVLLRVWNDDPGRLRSTFELLLRLFRSPSDPAPIDLPSDDQQLVAAFRAQMGVEARGHFPLAWAATVLAEGSPESVEAVRRHVVDKVEDPLMEIDLDDLRRLVPSPSTTESRALMDLVRARLAERDQDNGHDAFFASLGLSEFPATFQFMATLPGKGGNKATFMISRQWRSSIAEWTLNVGKTQARYLISSRGLMVNKLKLERYTLNQLETALRATAEAMKTQWIGPWEADVEEGFETSLIPRMNQRFHGILTPQKVRKRSSVKRSRGVASKAGPKSVAPSSPTSTIVCLEKMP